MLIPRTPRLLAILTGAALFALPARAEGPRFGLQIHANGALDNLKDVTGTTPGAGVGFHLTFDLGGGHVLRPRLDAVFYAEHTFKNVAYKAHDLSLGADYLYFPAHQTTGLYLTAGLRVHRWSLDRTYPAVPPYPGGSDTVTSTDLGYAAGLGFDFNRTVGAELRFVGNLTDHVVSTDGSGGNVLQAGLTFRF